MAKVVDKQRKLARVQTRRHRAARDRHSRACARKPCFTTPNYFLENPRSPKSPQSRILMSCSICYVCKEKYTEIHPLLRPALSVMCGVELPQANGARRFARDALRC
jgi:hypothetical protein